MSFQVNLEEGNEELFEPDFGMYPGSLGHELRLRPHFLLTSGTRLRLLELKDLALPGPQKHVK